jgi:hypothetical protein
MYVSTCSSLYSRLVVSFAQVSVVQDLDQAVYIDRYFVAWQADGPSCTAILSVDEQVSILGYMHKRGRKGPLSDFHVAIRLPCRHQITMSPSDYHCTAISSAGEQ